MNRISTLNFGLSIVLVSSTAVLAQTEVEIYAADSVRVYADFHQATEDAPVILLFHQAGTNGRAEYASIVPRLVEEGYSVLVTDQRSGGTHMGGTNRTVAALGNVEIGYCEAMPDMEAALNYALRASLGDPVFVWGSSYSAALVIRLAAARPDDVDGVLAFSPAAGEPMEGCSPNEVAADLDVPLLALRPQREMEHEEVAAQLALFEEQGHSTYVSENGVHGSSMLVEERTKSPTDNTWSAVLAFLDSVRD